jgi:hypothetical protein
VRTFNAIYLLEIYSKSDKDDIPEPEIIGQIESVLMSEEDEQDSENTTSDED